MISYYIILVKKQIFCLCYLKSEAEELKVIIKKYYPDKDIKIEEVFTIDTKLIEFFLKKIN